MEFLAITTSIFAFLAFIIIACIVFFILGLCKVITLNAGLWIMLVLAFLIVCLAEIILFWIIKYERQDRKEKEEIERQRKA